MATKISGITSIKIGNIASDGGMGTQLFTLGETVQGTAKIETADNTIKDFFVEEYVKPIVSRVSQYGDISMEWSSYNVGYYSLSKIFGGTGNLAQAVGSVNVLGALTAGTSYVAGFYENVPLTGSAGGTGTVANITVSGGGVTSVELVALGSGHSATNTLTCASSLIGGAGSGWSIVITSVHSAIKKESWSAPDLIPNYELSVQVTDNSGAVVEIPRFLLSAKLGLIMTKEELGKIDIKGKILQPTKSGVSPFTIKFA
jgi:hypothetical protein